MTTDTLRLDDQLCFALYAATNAITRSYRVPLAQLGLTYPQFLVLIALMEEESLTSGQLARALKLDAGTLTPMLKRLATAGLIVRKRRVADERVIDNCLSAAGRALQADLASAQMDVRCRTGMSDADLNMLRGTLQALVVSLGVPEACEAEAVAA